MTTTRSIWLLLFVGLVLAGHLAWIDDGPCGQDAWILVEASRVEDSSGLAGLFAQELRDGVRPSTAFYRPLVNLSFALDGVVFGESWRARHASSILLHLLASLALAGLARRLGARAGIAWSAGLLFALHPLSVEVVPAPARRGESLVLLLLLLSAWSLAGAENRPSRWAWAAGMGALAPLAKETGFLLPVLWAALPLESSWRRRVIASVATVLPALLLRTLALGGEGGYGGGWEFSSAGLVDAFVDFADPFRLYGGWGAHGLVLIVVVVSAWLVFGGHRIGAGLIRAGLVWWLAPMLLVTLARGIAAWYLYVPLAGWCLLLAGLAHAATAGFDRPRLAMLAVAGVATVLPVALPSPLIHDYPEWKIAGRASARALEVADERLEEWVGSTLTVAGLPREVHLSPQPRFHVRSATGVSADALRRYVELRTARNVDVGSLADLVITGEGAWTLDCNPTGEDDVLLRTEGAARLLPPMWPGPKAVDFEAGATELRTPLHRGECWVWSGSEWNRVTAPIGAEHAP